jgi:hypothetical protein
MGELFCTRCEQLLGTDSVKEVKTSLLNRDGVALELSATGWTYGG